ncbi:hypothetical protein [Paracraurococcus lichenis]|uniref:Uncharacterized protein n=1 Tax=Paracraurococcus lichenis TaxID=3064888 RepID=A0ABT9E3C4_9PROT|nr:hypothetical protein [Paracraurococcus sp. LOR1-02]MDO9710607.1 hypothetical protein [Paracraurococcus sp. LOR1-02]
MAKRVIETVGTDGVTPPLYFLGYRDHGQGWECLWTPSRTRARFFDADEAEIEIRLIAPFVEPRRILSAQPVLA